MTQEQRDAWSAVKAAFDGGPFYVRYESANYIVREFLQSLKDIYQKEIPDD
jgi:hypothetical protein